MICYIPEHHPISVEDIQSIHRGTDGSTLVKRRSFNSKYVWNLRNGDRIVTKCNEYDQQDNKGGRVLGGWLGKIGSEIGKRARAHQIAPHTIGSQSFARKKYKFRNKYKRDPTPLEWYSITQKHKEEGFVNQVSEQLMGESNCHDGRENWELR
ncbi:hypothetical protein AAHA92_17314 [Salvia divinorum]|uniref:Uncharacterized protein n=1 Tax=Salvia divinorum TaxID=28513 RepID=A0ABD1GYD5_SALDI